MRKYNPTDFERQVSYDVEEICNLDYTDAVQMCLGRLEEINAMQAGGNTSQDIAVYFKLVYICGIPTQDFDRIVTLLKETPDFIKSVTQYHWLDYEDYQRELLSV